MNSYILLRRNKETGPFTKAQLEQMGLKSSDLLWVECQSVCWQHPGEIPDLKTLLSEKIPPSRDDKKESFAINNDSVAVTSNDTVEIPLPKTENKKLVFVELPADVPATKKQDEKLSFTEPDPDIYKYGGLGSNSVTPKLEKASPDLTVKYNRPLDEIKEMYVKNMEQEKLRPRGIRSLKLPKQFKKIAVYTSLVLVGAIAMLLIKNTSGKGPVASQQNTHSPAIQNTTNDTVSTEPDQVTAVMQVADEQEAFPIEEPPFSNSEDKKSDVAVKKSLPGETKGEKSVPENSDTEIEKNTQPVNETTEAKPIPAEIISSMVSVKANDYIVGSFGGIRNLEMTLQNESKYLLDKVTVEIKYLNPEGIILKTEHLLFQSVFPGGTETIAVKKSKRGTKVAYKITNIESKETAPGTTGL